MLRYTFSSPMNLTIEHTQMDPATSLIVMRGKLLLGPECKQLEALIPELLAAGNKTLVFDLSEVTHIDSTGIGRFIDTFGRLKKAGGQMRLAGASGVVRESFRITRLDTVFSLYPTVEAACVGLPSK
jgi:anti-sigma B factor antagonist